MWALDVLNASSFVSKVVQVVKILKREIPLHAAAVRHIYVLP
jgi:hypothetical protein